MQSCLLPICKILGLMLSSVYMDGRSAHSQFRWAEYFTAPGP